MKGAFADVELCYHKEAKLVERGFSRSQSTESLELGPVSDLPKCQSKVGKRLILQIVGGWGSIVVWIHPSYYPKFRSQMRGIKTAFEGLEECLWLWSSAKRLWKESLRG